jgi:hypothetical protein
MIRLAGARLKPHCSADRMMHLVVPKLFTKWILLAVLFAAVSPGRCDLLFVSEPLRLVGEPAFSADGLNLLVDAVSREPVALLQDPSQRLTSEIRPRTLQGVQNTTAASDLPVLRVTDLLPDFWAAPAMWQHFQAGPESFSGVGRDQRIKDWAGRPQTDRRAYALDNGAAPRSAAAALAPRGAGRLTVSRGRAYLSLGWSGFAGRIYALEFTPDLKVPFRALQTFINPQDGVVTIGLSLDGRSSYYRVAELSP